MISQSVNGLTISLLWGDVFIAVYAELAGITDHGGRKNFTLQKPTRNKARENIGDFAGFALSPLRYRLIRSIPTLSLFPL